MQLKSGILKSLLFTILPLLFAASLWSSGALESFENNLTDLRYRLFHPGHPIAEEVVVLEIDEQTLLRFGSDPRFGRWPWPRSAWVPLLEFLGQWGPKGVLFDLIFFEDGPTDGDLALANQFYPFVSHSADLRSRDETWNNDENQAADELFRLWQSEVVSTIEPHSIPFRITTSPEQLWPHYNFGDISLPSSQILATTPYLHVVSYQPDSDGVSRHGQHLFCYEAQCLPSLALRGYLLYSAENPFAPLASEVELKGRRLHIRTSQDGGEWNERAVYLKDGHQAPVHFPAESTLRDNHYRFSVAAALESKELIDSGLVADPEELPLNPLLLQDKIIIIGATAAATHDTKITPYGSLPGVLLHAVLLSNLIQGDSLWIAPRWLGPLLAVILLLFAAPMTFLLRNIYLRFFFPGAILIGYTLIGLLLFKFHIHWPLAPFLATFPLSFLGASAYLTVTEGKEKKRIKSAMSKYLSPEVVNDMVNSGIDPRAEVGHREVLTVLFSDIRSFTTLSEKSDAATVVGILNEYLSRMVAVVFEEKGTLDKFIGDAIMAFWGAPKPLNDHADRAVSAGLKMIRELDDLHVSWHERGLPLLQIGIGLHSGEMIVGNIGSEQRLDYTVIGDNVNLGSRVEGLTKEYGVRLMISEATLKAMQRPISCRLLDFVAVKGKSVPVAIYEPLDPERPPRIEGMSHEEYAKAFERAFDLYLHRQFSEAERAYLSLMPSDGSKDRTIELMSERCRLYSEMPPSAEWNGAFVMQNK